MKSVFLHLSSNGNHFTSFSGYAHFSSQVFKLWQSSLQTLLHDFKSFFNRWKYSKGCCKCVSGSRVVWTTTGLYADLNRALFLLWRRLVMYLWWLNASFHCCIFMLREQETPLWIRRIAKRTFNPASRLLIPACLSLVLILYSSHILGV